MKRQSPLSLVKHSFTAATLGVLAACGGAGGGATIADGGIRGTGASVGPVSGFGSVFVNGVRFDTADILNRVVDSDDGIGSEAELAKGMILRVNGEWAADGQGTAESMAYDDSLRGAITVTRPWDPVTLSAEIAIYGQTVQIDRQTVIQGKLVADLADGDLVRVSGWRLATGGFRASYIGLLTGGSEDDVELEGRIDTVGFNPDQNHFQINGLRIEYSDDAFDDDFTEAGLVAGRIVEVEGRIELRDSGPVLVAREIEEDDDRRYRSAAGAGIEFAGPVAAAYEAASGTFTTNGITVRIDSETRLDDLTLSDLQPGLLVQVEGDVLDDGSVQADEVGLREANARVEGAITTGPDLTAMTLEVGGVLVRVTGLTLIADDDETTRLALADLQSGQQIEVEGIERESGGEVWLEALKIGRDDDDDAASRFELEGRLGDIDGQGITVLGVQLLINGTTEFDDVSAAELESGLANGVRPVLEVEYYRADGVYYADEIELEAQDDD
ncbi:MULTISPECIES: DUF5666 domain-containing protein [Marinobacter]|uniref:DUF5666 domain-containing protein n=1 Tax=Marinobacter profundi TaxID=2666256 RepID=A0A2G1UNG1_9GAMM|nr:MULTISPECIES: DUF5666 domain-containing protein [Marinobacter]MBD3655067.1 hypothetical protein [Marinobacter sp.]PHQ16046.1 hypothetical protein CLH61_07535 [Marinobacter profundi]